MTAVSVVPIIARRLLMLIGVLLGVTVVTFLISHVIPGDPAQLMAGPEASTETVAHMRAQLGLDRPLGVQYLSYLKALLHGDLGESIVTHRLVTQELLSHLPATLEVMLCALLISIVMGVSLGTLSAVLRGGVVDHMTRLVAIIGISTPSFVLGLLLFFIFYGELGVLPAGGRISTLIEPPHSITGLYVIDSLMTGNWTAMKSALEHLTLPAITLGFLTAGSKMRLIRSSMLEVLDCDYIRTARAFGLRRRTIILRYALKNALIPFVTVLGTSLATLLFGSVVVESIFGWPGAGSYMINAIFALDFPVIMGFTVIISIVYVIANLLVDLAYLALDPRIRVGG